MSPVLSEYPLSPDDELHVPGEALWIDGVGAIGQHFSYLETAWEKGVPYFVRDVYFAELEAKQARGACARDIADKLKDLNSKICAYEAQCHTQSLLSIANPVAHSQYSQSPLPGKTPHVVGQMK